MRRLVKDELVKASATGGRDLINQLTAKGRAKVKAGSVVSNEIERRLNGWHLIPSLALIISQFTEDDNADD